MPEPWRYPVAAGTLAALLLCSTPAFAQATLREPKIPTGDCVSISGPAGPEDLVRLPGRKSVLVSSAKRNLLTRKPRGRVVRIDLERCQAGNLTENCATFAERVYQSPERLSVVGMDLRPADAGFKLVLVESGRECRVLELTLDAGGTLVDEMILGKCRDRQDRESSSLTPRLNGIGVSNRGDVLVTNATKHPGLAFRAAGSSTWMPVHKPGFGFANGVAFLPPTSNGKPSLRSKPEERRRQHVLVADFTRQAIHLLRYSEDGLEPKCRLPVPSLPDNLHWVEGKEGERLLVGTFGSLSTSVAYVLHLARKAPAEVWEVNVSSLLARLDRGENPPADCGIGAPHWRLLASDPESQILAGASAAVKVDDLLVIGQLRRPRLMVCRWPDRPDQPRRDAATAGSEPR